MNRAPAYVDRDVRALLDAADPDAKDFFELTPAEARDAMDAMVDGMLPPVDLPEVRNVSIPADGREIDARLYLPDTSQALPLLVYFHGGGWEIGSLDNTDRPVRRLARDAGFAVLSVDYRLTPEHPFPAGLDDCYAATAWARTHTAQLGSDGEFFAVGGDSAGGNLAAAVAQLSRDRVGPAIDHQLLVYPVVTPQFDSLSYEQFASGYFLTRATMQSFWQMYVGDPASRPPYADLYAAGPLSGLAPATIITCGLDPLRSEGEDYAERLAQAGVAVTLTRVYGLLHGIWFMDAIGPRAYQFGIDIALALRRAVSKAAASTTPSST